MTSLTVNGKAYEVDVEPGTPLLWVLRDTLGLTGTSYGCGIAQCGACYGPRRRARDAFVLLPIGSITAGAEITTIEGLAKDGTCIRFSKPGSTTMCRNADTARAE